MKQWLANNKIYFEFVSTILFGAASIFLAVASYYVSQNQLKIAKIQLEPHIFVGEKYLRDGTGVASETFLEISNAGSPVYGFSVNSATFYTVSTNSETIWIPVNGYYNVTFELDAVTGKLAEVRGKNNNLTFGKAYTQQVNSDWDAVLGYAELGRATITRVRYETRAKEVSEEYFIGEHRSDELWVKELFQKHQKGWLLEIKELDWPKIVEASLKIKKDEPSLVRNEGF